MPPATAIDAGANPQTYRVRVTHNELELGEAARTRRQTSAETTRRAKVKSKEAREGLVDGKYDSAHMRTQRMLASDNVTVRVPYHREFFHPELNPQTSRAIAGLPRAVAEKFETDRKPMERRVIAANDKYKYQYDPRPAPTYYPDRYQQTTRAAVGVSKVFESDTLSRTQLVHNSQYRFNNVQRPLLGQPNEQTSRAEIGYANEPARSVDEQWSQYLASGPNRNTDAGVACQEAMNARSGMQRRSAQNSLLAMNQQTQRSAVGLANASLGTPRLATLGGGTATLPPNPKRLPHQHLGQWRLPSSGRVGIEAAAPYNPQTTNVTTRR